MARLIDLSTPEEREADERKAKERAEEEAAKRAEAEQRETEERRVAAELAERERLEVEEQAAREAEEYERQLEERIRLASEAALDLMHLRNSPFFDTRVRERADRLEGVSKADLVREINRLIDEQATEARQSTEPEMWPGPVDGEELLNDLCAGLGRFIDAHDDVLAILSLWICHSYVFDTWQVTPRLYITSEKPGCGKSTTIDLLKLLVFRPEWSDNISTAAFAELANYQGTILLDEFDKAPTQIMQPLHSGAKRGTVRTRMQNGVAVQQNYFTPVVLSGIGDLKSEPLAHRSIRIEQFKSEKNDNEISHYNALIHATDYVSLRQRAQRWLYDIEERLKGLERSRNYSFTFLSGCDPRFKDRWRPILAIAQVAGPAWLKRTQDIMNRYYNATLVHDPTHQLLNDVREIFEASGKDRLHTEDILKALWDRSDREWDDYQKKGRGITAAEFARIVKPEFRKAGVPVRPKKSKNVRIGQKSAAGYYRREFEPVWTTYGIGVTGSQDKPEPATGCDPVTPKLKPIRERKRKRSTNAA